MADLVLGLAKSVLEGTLSKATAAIEAETTLRQSAKRNLVFITGEFQMMQSFLQVANAERVENAVVMTWVRQIRELAYDVEDCVEFVIHLDTKSSWLWSHRLIPSFCLSSPLPLDVATQELEELKARVEEVSRRNQNYNLISDTGSKPVVVQQQPAAAAAATALGNSMLIGGASGTGRMQQGDLTQLLAGASKDLQVISVWGSEGNLGVTSIIWKAYSNKMVCQDFTCRAWVKLIHPFDSIQLVRGLTDQFYANQCKEVEKNIGLDVFQKTPEASNVQSLDNLGQQLNKQRYLVVLEDLSTMTDWDVIRNFFPRTNNGSRIIICTQQSEVASLSVGHPYQVLELNQFSADHSVYAFYKEGSQSEEDTTKKTLDYSSTSNSKNKGADIKEESQRDEDASEEGKHVVSGKRIEALDWIKNNTLFGRDTEMNVLHRYITDVLFDSIQFMSVWGIAGVGKSSLVKKLFCDKIINDKNPGGTFDKYGWVDVSYPFKLRHFSQSLLQNFHSESLETKETAYSDMAESNNPIAECQGTLKNNKCLVVIDGLQSADQWDLIQNELLSGSSDNCIITIATEASLATHCCGAKGDYVFNVKGLEANVAYGLFKTMVSAAGNPLPSRLSDDDVLELEELVSKCGGLPKVIVEIAFSLGKKSVEKMKSVRSLSNNFMHDLEKNREFDKLQGLFGWVRTYFQSCPDFLKPCIFYLSIFPRDFFIRRRRLLRRWIAECYSRDNHEEFAEQISEKQFSGLLDLSLIQQQRHKIANTEQSVTGKILYQVNGFIREYIVSRRMEENLVFELGENSTITTQRTGRHLVILESWKRDRILFENMDFSRLRSLTVFGVWESFFISDSMRFLRVLDLENASKMTENDLKKVVKVLRRLKFLSLRGHSEIFNLPSSLHKLRQLETLDVRGTSITTLPEKITKLQQLQYIRAGTKCVLCPVSSSEVSVPAADLSSNVTDQASTSNNNVPAPASSSNVTDQASSSNVTDQSAVSTRNCNWLLGFGRCQRPTVSTVDAPATILSSNGSVDSLTHSSCSWLPGFCTCHLPIVGVELLIETGRLTALHTLGVVDIAASGANSILEGLKQLTQLRKLSVSGINRKNSKKFFSAIQGHAYLESLSVQFDMYNQYCCFRNKNNNTGHLDDMLSLPCGNLLSLKLYGLEDKLPSWGDNKLRKLTKLELDMASLSIDGIRFLGKLTELCILRFKQLKDVQLHFLVAEHGEEDHSYEKLKVLEIGSNSDKLSVTFGSKTMKELELLKLDCPSALSFQLSGAKNLKKLKEVRLVKGFNYKAQEEHLKTQIMEHPNQIKPVVLLEEAPHST